MSITTFSRSFLQGLPEQRKQQHIDLLIREFIHDLQNAAAEGKTSYMYSPRDLKEIGIRLLNKPPITNDELVSAFKKKFPDCDVSYQETWVNVSLNKKILKKGIIIDWS